MLISRAIILAKTVSNAGSNRFDGVLNHGDGLFKFLIALVCFQSVPPPLAILAAGDVQCVHSLSLERCGQRRQIVGRRHVQVSIEVMNQDSHRFPSGLSVIGSPLSLMPSF